MTNQEAIEQLKWVRNRISDITYSPESFEAINLAIEALEDIEEWDKLRLICANEGIFVYKEKED